MPIQSTSAAPAGTAIAQLLTTSAAYWNRGDLDAFMRSYEDSPATTYISSKVIIHGYDRIRAHYAAEYKPGGAGVLSFSNLSIRMLGPQYAVVVARWHLATAHHSSSSGLFSLVLHRSSAGWRIIDDHSP